MEKRKLNPVGLLLLAGGIIMAVGSAMVLSAQSDNGKAGGLLILISGGALQNLFFYITKTRIKNGALNMAMVWNYMGIVVMIAGVVVCFFQDLILCGALLAAGGGALFLLTTVRSFLFIREENK